MASLNTEVNAQAPAEQSIPALPEVATQTYTTAEQPPVTIQQLDVPPSPDVIATTTETVPPLPTQEIATPLPTAVEAVPEAAPLPPATTTETVTPAPETQAMVSPLPPVTEVTTQAPQAEPPVTLAAAQPPIPVTPAKHEKRVVASEPLRVTVSNLLNPKLLTPVTIEHTLGEESAQ